MVDLGYTLECVFRNLNLFHDHVRMCVEMGVHNTTGTMNTLFICLTVIVEMMISSSTAVLWATKEMVALAKVV